jgi:hypothetical protein
MVVSSPASSSVVESEPLPDPADAPMRDLSALPLILLAPDIARIYRRSLGTIRRDCQRGTFHPPPYDTRPYRWLRAAVEQDLDERSRQAAAATRAAAPRPAQPTRRRR